MATIRHKDKRTGITYVYDSFSYWDKEKKQPRAKRRLIGRLDEETGEIIPTDGRGRKRSPYYNPKKDATLPTPRTLKEYKEEYKKLLSENKELREEVTRLRNLVNEK